MAATPRRDANHDAARLRIEFDCARGARRALLSEEFPWGRRPRRCHLRDAFTVAVISGARTRRAQPADVAYSERKPESRTLPGWRRACRFRRGPHTEESRPFDRVLEALDAHRAIRADVLGRRGLTEIGREPPRRGIRTARPVGEPGLGAEQERWRERCAGRERNSSTSLPEILCYNSSMAEWGFLTNHGRALLCIANDPGVRLRDIADLLGITERSAYAIVNDLAGAGYVLKEREGRRNRYIVQKHLRCPRRRFANERSARFSTCSSARTTYDERTTPPSHLPPVRKGGALSATKIAR